MTCAKETVFLPFAFSEVKKGTENWEEWAEFWMSCSAGPDPYPEHIKPMAKEESPLQVNAPGELKNGDLRETRSPKFSLESLENLAKDLKALALQPVRW